MIRLVQHFIREASVLKLKIITKKLVSLCLVTSLIFIPANAANAANLSQTVAQPEEMRERVFAEVLSGEITKDEDVIKIALEQYQEKMKYRAGLCTLETVADEGLSITQILDSYTDEDGNVIDNVVTTGLLVLDENNRLIDGTSIKTESSGLSQYSIYATMNVSETNDTSLGAVRFNWFETKLTYGTSITAGSLVQSSKYKTDYVWEYDDITKQINYPQANVAYRYTPTNTQMIGYMNYGGRSCYSLVNTGSRTFALGYRVIDGAVGYWVKEYN